MYGFEPLSSSSYIAEVSILGRNGKEGLGVFWLQHDTHITFFWNKIHGHQTDTVRTSQLTLPKFSRQID